MVFVPVSFPATQDDLRIAYSKDRSSINKMSQPPPAPGVNGAAPIRKKPSGASSLFKPTNNQKNRYPLGSQPKPPPPRPVQQSNGVVAPNFKSVTAFSRNDKQQTASSQAQNGPVKEYKLVTSKRELMEGLRYHLLQLSDKVPLDIRKESDFTKPARLHRRNPDWKDKSKDANDAPAATKDAETEALDKRREARQKEREANMAQIAPSTKTGKNKLYGNKQKSAQVIHHDFTDEEKRRLQMNYEEKVPWVLEDFDNKHTLVGKHNQGSMGVYAAFAYEQNADGERFRLVPVEKFYKFDRHSTVHEDVTWEQLEQHLKQSRKLADHVPATLARKQEEREHQQMKEKEWRKNRGLFVADQSVRMTREGEDADLDFDEDFADDEEGDIFGDKDEDEKAAEKKVKEDHLSAKIGWGEKDEQEVERQEAEELKAEKMKKYWGGDMKRALEKREHNYNLGSDSDGSYTSVSSSNLLPIPLLTSYQSDSEEERERLEAEKLANAKKDEETAKSALSSGANTPSGRKEKHNASDREGGIKKSSSSRTLKRPGSPNLSDASGTDASTIRKKKRKNHHSSSQQPTPGGSRPMSPDGIRPRAAGSDTEGGAMSDGSKIKLKMKRPGSPSGPNSPPTSRAGSPGPAANRPRNLDIHPFPTAEEIRSKIPADGLPVKDFLAMYKSPSDPKRKAEWTAHIKKLLRTENGRIRLRESAAK